MSDNEIISILDRFSDILEINSAWVWPFKWLGWALIKMLSSLVELVSGVADQLFVLDTFYKNKEVIAFIDSFKPVIWVLFALALVGVGYRVMFTKNKDFQSVAVNFAIALAVIVALPVTMDKMMDITREGVNFINTDSLGEEENYADKIIKDNITDVLLYEKNGFSSTNLSKTNNIPIKNIRGISATDSINPDDIKSDYKEVFENKLSIGADGKMELVEMNQGATDIFKEYYGRYKISYFYIIISLGVVAATQVFTSLKLGRLIFELAYNQLLALIVAPLDISSGQRLKKIIENIISVFFVTILISALLKFYIIFVSVASDMGGIAGVILLIAGSFAVIDGPNIVEKLFGIDAGIQSGFKMIAGTYAALKTGGAIAKGAAQGASLAAGVATKGGAGALAGAAGVVGLGKGISKGLSNDSGQSGSEQSENSSEERADSKGESGMYSEMEKSESESSEETKSDERPGSLYQDMDGNQDMSRKSEKDSGVKPQESQKPSIDTTQNSKAGNTASESNSEKTSGGVERPPISQESPKTDTAKDSADNIERPSISKENQTPNIGSTAPIAPNKGESASKGSEQISRPSVANENKPLGGPESARNTSTIDRPSEPVSNGIGSVSGGLNSIPDNSASVTERPVPESRESISESMASTGQSKPETAKPAETVRDTRTIEQALGDVMKSKLSSSTKYQNIKKAYNLSLNSGENIGKKIKGKESS